MKNGVPVLILLVLVCSSARSQDSGAAVFQAHCQSCHHPSPLPNAAPPLSVLATMSRQQILATLEKGHPKTEASALTPDQRNAVAEFLSLGTAPELGKPNLCSAAQKFHKNSATWNGWGVDQVNSRFQPAAAAGLKPDDVSKLRLKWVFGVPDTDTMYGQPSVVDGRLYFGSFNGLVYSLDADSGCTHWVFRASAGVRTSILLSPDKKTAYFGDQAANVYAVDAGTGRAVWTKKVDDHPSAIITGSPQLVGAKLFVPVSSTEEYAAANAKYSCCSFRGSMVALRASDGTQIWKTYTIDTPAKDTIKSSAGVQQRGPSGAAVWLAPTIDPAKNLLYVATGDNYSSPTTDASDAVLAFDRDTGRILWKTQVTPKDAFNFSCIGNKANCPEETNSDFDFGAPPLLRSLPDKKRILIAAQKSGMVYGLDPDQQGKIVWQTRVAKGGKLGGILWGGTADASAVYFPISDTNLFLPGVGGGISALRPDSGEKLWNTPAPEPACAGQPGCSAGQMAPATVIPGMVFSGSADGHLRAYATSDGHVLWDFDTLRSFDTVNGVKGRGGSLNATGPVIVGGMLFVTSGYGRFGLPGNVLLAFSRADQ